jgi:uncharacterized protein YjaG (DUF416 family)
MVEQIKILEKLKEAAHNDFLYQDSEGDLYARARAQDAMEALTAAIESLEQPDPLESIRAQVKAMSCEVINSLSETLKANVCNDILKIIDKHIEVQDELQPKI